MKLGRDRDTFVRVFELFESLLTFWEIWIASGLILVGVFIREFVLVCFIFRAFGFNLHISFTNFPIFVSFYLSLISCLVILACSCYFPYFIVIFVFCLISLGIRVLLRIIPMILILGFTIAKKIVPKIFLMIPKFWLLFFFLEFLVLESCFVILI